METFDLTRFIEAQDRVYETVLKELGAGEKRSHWMWYIFPQIKGLGGSSMAQRYAIGSRNEARAYRAHPVLGPRLLECTQLVLNVDGRTAEQIFSYPDYLKFRSSMTLFGHADSSPNIFQNALSKYFGGEADP